MPLVAHDEKKGSATLTAAQWKTLTVKSLQGVDDKSLSAEYGVAANTIRQRRYVDPVWQTAHDQLKGLKILKTETKQELTKAATTPLSLSDLSTIHPGLVANFAHTQLKLSIEQGLLPLPTTWSEAKTADDMARRAMGLDDKTTNVNVSLWAGGGVTSRPSVIVEGEIVGAASPEAGGQSPETLPQETVTPESEWI